MATRGVPAQRNVRLVKIAPGDNAFLGDDCRRGGYICVGWDEVGDLRKFDSKDEFKAAFRRCYKEYPASTASQKANELWTLMELRPGDKIIANDGLTEVVGLGTVERPAYKWMPARKDYRHTVRVRWNRTEWGQSDYKKIPRQNWNNTVAPVSRQLFERILGRSMPQNVAVTTGKALEEDRKMLLRRIRQRIGQPKFRHELLRAYGSRCAVSDCDIPEVLEAAHIDPKRRAVPCNGILLRADFHLLFDLGWMTIDPDSLRIRLSANLKGSRYWQFHNKRIRLPNRSDWQPARGLLEHRHRLFLSGP